MRNTNGSYREKLSIRSVGQHPGKTLLWNTRFAIRRKNNATRCIGRIMLQRMSKTFWQRTALLTNEKFFFVSENQPIDEVSVEIRRSTFADASLTLQNGSFLSTFFMIILCAIAVILYKLMKKFWPPPFPQCKTESTKMSMKDARCIAFQKCARRPMFNVQENRLRKTKATCRVKIYRVPAQEEARLTSPSTDKS